MLYKGEVKKRMRNPGGYVLTFNIYDEDDNIIMDKLPSIKFKEGKDYDKGCSWKVPKEGDEVRIKKEDGDWILVEY